MASADHRDVCHFGGDRMTTICRSYLAILAVYHVFTGVVSFAFPHFALRFYRTLYACDPVEQQQLVLVMKPWGALAVFAGFAGGWAAVDPRRYIGVVAALWILLVLRITFRIGWRRELGDLGRIPSHRNLISTAALGVGALILGVWLAGALPSPVH